MSRRSLLASLLGTAIAPALEPFKGTAFSFLGNVVRKPKPVWNGTVWVAVSNFLTGALQTFPAEPDSNGVYNYQLKDGECLVQANYDAVDYDKPPIHLRVTDPSMQATSAAIILPGGSMQWSRAPQLLRYYSSYES